MQNRSYVLQVFIIKRKNFGEADKFITVFSREYGKVTLKAKGIRKISSRRAGDLELFNQATLLVVKGRGDMDVITEVQLTRNYTHFCNDYYKTHIAYQLVELVDKLTGQHEKHEDLYKLLDLAFTYLSQATIDHKTFQNVVMRFKIRILDILGFGVPSTNNHTILTEHIEAIMERKLLAGKSFDII